MSDILDLIDSTVDGLCACGCGIHLKATSRSGWFATESCQGRWQAGDESGAELRRQRERFERYGEYLAVVARVENGPPLVWDRRPSPVQIALTNNSTPPVRSSESRLGYRRPCSGCGQMRAPVFAAIPRIAADFMVDIMFGNPDPPQYVTATVDHAHACSNCMKPFPAPALWARVWPDGQQYQLHLAEQPGGRGPVMVISQDAAYYREMVDGAWRELEYYIEDSNRPLCMTPGCTDKAREKYIVQPRTSLLGQPYLHLLGRDWTGGETIHLCPRHASALLRGEDPAVPGERLADLADAPMAMWGADGH